MGEKDGRFVVLQGALFSPLVHERDSPISPTFDMLPFLPCVSLEHEIDQSLSASVVGCKFASNPIDIEENIIRYGRLSIDS